MNRDLKELVWKRAASFCEYCQLSDEYSALPFEIDHVIGLTPEGRTTIDVLRINHLDAVSVRTSLIEEGVFPPSFSSIE